ncbi:2-amino-4-hydroxy-6-hydroxymethyldihydropteridine diphosphokinase [Pseudolysobacter antarcticus]|uniref:2-amino-4-hydroxy-6-hydroxymethyldihydropteridine pyrophosphokinase n=1 Tax=Pseudolysobacter antarcticus TaxID=2511995 RepID=A0A411HNX8_9GAMM|nr:2-amino-4-hydroxy-6-hydroxymethyldihydropteridine diphosphokinase [Pseudolysobacter antarcticus]QBB72184.1 2-amino-4-hydroxy-6-hydroxymethyldihydropteridine diphosphokinase [Pseudolysobacter antarcticus]
MPYAYLSLGSNIDPEKNLRAAILDLRAQFGAVVLSSLYRCRAIGFDGPDFLNMAAIIETTIPPVELNDWLHRLEDQHGRRRDQPRFASRTLDIDIVLYDDLILRGAGNLELPRKELKHAFVLCPLAEIAPLVLHPLLHKTLAQLWLEFDVTSEPLERLADILG